jgi:spoIIIJ-associated protein
LEESIEIAKELTVGLVERIGLKATVEGFLREGNVYIEIKGDREGVLIGRYGRTLESLQILINRMVNKRLEKPVRVVLDIDDYRRRRADTLARMATQMGAKAKRSGRSLTIGPFSAHDRRIIHMALKEDPSLRTQSFGEGEMKKITITPERKEEGETKTLQDRGE